MNYIIPEIVPNTIPHKVGAIVFHESDALRPDMAMQVIGYDAAHCRTQYIHPENGDREIYANTIDRLYTLETHPDFPALNDPTNNFTHPFYWNCQCENNYIHKQGDQNHCPICGTLEHEAPESSTAEVLNPSLHYKSKVIQF